MQRPPRNAKTLAPRRRDDWRTNSMESVMTELPAAVAEHLRMPDPDALRPAASTHKPRILILYGSLRETSYSRLLAEESGRLLEQFGCEVRIFDPRGLPLPDAEPATHPKVQE